MMMMMMLLVVVIILVLRLWYILPQRITKGIGIHKSSKQKQIRRREPCSAVIVLGSGGHTTEMLKLITKLPRQYFKELTFLVADTDHTSIKNLEKEYVRYDSFVSYRGYSLLIILV